jgi:hypothetical protein
MPGKSSFKPAFARRSRANRRGTITLWTILFLPVLVVLFLVAIEAIHIWLARVELENALEAAALAAVKEWAEDGGAPVPGWTAGARIVGLDYGEANTIRRVDFSTANFEIEGNLGTFSNPGNPNENATCTLDGVANPPIDREGNLIFGAITNDNPLEDCANLVFTTEEIPGCGGEGTVLVDATGEGTLDTGKDNDWGVAFLNDAETDPNLRICTLAITLPPGVKKQDYYFDPTTFGFSDNSNNIFANEGACDQNDVVGINTGTITYQFFLPAACSAADPNNEQLFKQIQFTFLLDGSVNEFGPCDRFRFGIKVGRLSTARCTLTSEGDGELMGDIGTSITVVFADSGDLDCAPLDPARTASATFQNEPNWRNRVCAGVDPFCNGHLDPLDDSHILTPPGIPNLPNGPIQNNPNKDGQSHAFLDSAGGRYAYAVRAQALIEVPLLCGEFCGVVLGPFHIGACSTAMYDCESGRPLLVRVEEENFTCVVP